MCITIMDVSDESSSRFTNAEMLDILYVASTLDLDTCLSTNAYMPDSTEKFRLVLSIL